MIKVAVENKLKDSLDLIINETIEYFGSEYKEEILKSAKKVKLTIVKDNSVYRVAQKDIYVGEEAICIKEDKSHIVMPSSLVYGNDGNVIFVHCLLHALGEEPFVRGERDAFNETIVEYMASEISKKLEEKRINISASDSPIYSSNSYYACMFEDVSVFYEENKDKIVAARMGKKVSFDEEEINEYVNKIQSNVDVLFFNGETSQENFRALKR